MSIKVEIEKKKCGRKAKVSRDKIEEVLSGIADELFDENAELKKEKKQRVGSKLLIYCNRMEKLANIICI